jgi:hypothetical protein
MKGKSAVSGESRGREIDLDKEKNGEKEAEGMERKTEQQGRKQWKTKLHKQTQPEQ